MLGSGILTGQQTAFEQQSRALLKVRAPLCMRVMVADMHVRWVHCIDTVDKSLIVASIQTEDATE